MKNVYVNWNYRDPSNANVDRYGDAERFMKGLKMAETRKGYIIHRFMGDARTPFARPQDHVLCMSVKEENIWTQLEPVDVTIINADVTCQECLELIHA